MDYQHIEIERGGHVATVRFNRPDRANALNPRHIEEIEHAALSFRDDDDTRVVIFTGAGKHFCSGADLGEREPRHRSQIRARRRKRIGERCIQALRDMDQLTIAVWRGAAMGGGAAIATALDFRVGTRTCFMSYPEIKIGVNLMWQSLPLCVHLAGPAVAKRLVISGERAYGEQLLKWGLLDEVVEDDELENEAARWASLYASQAPAAAQMIKRSVNAISSALDRSIMHMDFDQNLLNESSADAAEAVAAYRAGRAPEFTGE
ncbi:MAG: enoyl-CoA hydratase/isomerase family protein [Pseudomonadota bacterium]